MHNRGNAPPPVQGGISKYEITLLDPSSYPEWDAFVQTARGGSVFNSTAWLKAVARLFGREVRIWGVRRSGELVAGVGVVSFKMLSLLKIAGLLPLTPYNSLVLKPRNSDKEARSSSHRITVFDLLARALEAEGDVVSIANHPSLTDVRPFLWRGWSCKVWYTYFLDISNIEAFWDSVYDEFRTKVRKARRRGFTSERGADAETLYRLYYMTYEKQGRRVYVDESSFCALCDVLKADNRLVTYVTRLDGEAVCAMGFVKDYTGELCAWVGGTHPDHLQHGVTPLTWWTAIEDLSREGYHRMDLCGASVPSIAAFKSQLGGELTPFFEVVSQNLKSRLFEWTRGKLEAWGAADWLKQKLVHSRGL